MKRKTSVSPTIHVPQPILNILSPAVLAVIALVVAIFGLYLFRLTSIVPAGSGELHTMQTSNTVSGLLDNPLLLPYKAVAFLLLQLPIENLLAVRLASLIIVCLSSVLFFVLAERWYGTLNASIATTLFATSGALVHAGRYGAGFGACVLAVLLLLNLVVWINNSDTAHSGRAVVLYTIGCSVMLYIPGGLWFVIAGSFLSRKAIIKHLKSAPAQYAIIASVITAVSVALLAVSLLRGEHTIFLQWLGLPDDMPTLVTLVKQGLSSITAFTIRGPFMPEIWLAHTPILDVASSILLLIGALFYARHLHNTRTHLLLLSFALGAFLVTLNGATALGFLVPVIYLVIASGIAYFLHQWKRVFPTNPIAKVVAYTIMGIMVLCIVQFHAQRYFTAWHHSPDTLQAYERSEQHPDPVSHLIQ